MLPRPDNLNGSTLLLLRLEAHVRNQGVSQAAELADFIIHISAASFEERCTVLEMQDVHERLTYVVKLLQSNVDRLKQMLNATTIISTNTTSPSSFMGRNSMFLREPRNATPSRTPSAAKRGSGEDDDLADLQQKLNEAHLSPEAAKVAERDMQRLQRMPPMQAEYQVLRSYLEILCEIPWKKNTDDGVDKQMLARARRQLDEDHFGLEKVKKRLIEYLAVMRLKTQMRDERMSLSMADRQQDGQTCDIATHEKTMDKAPILLLVGEFKIV